MTLVEIMIVVIIMALIATAVGIAVLPQMRDGQIRATRADVATIEQATELYLANGGHDCPRDTAELVAAGALRGTARMRDVWDHDFAIVCEGDDILVSSGGPDGRLGTEDDIHP